MKKLQKILALASVAAVIVTPAVRAADVGLSNFSLSGFIDMSVTDDEDGRSGGLDQFELNLGYDFGGGLTATVDLDYEDGSTGGNNELEQAFVTYAASDSLSVKAGRFLSNSGWETAEPTGLYQYSSTGYAKYFYGGYQQGVSALVSGDTMDFALSVVNDLSNPKGSLRDEGSAYEMMVAYKPSDALIVKGSYMLDENDVKPIKMVNIWSAYSADGLTLAAEFNRSENTAAAEEISGVDAEGRLLMANYAWDVHGVTLRYHETEVTAADGKTAAEDKAGITLAYSHAVTNNLSVITEYRLDDNNLTDDLSDTFAIEALVTF